jgi:hypothetical protein
VVPVTDPSAPADPEVRHLRAQAAGYARRGNAAASAEASRQLRLVQLEKHIRRIDDSAASAGIRLVGPVTCPRCGHIFQGSWNADRQDAAAQECDGCGHVFTAAWPGFRFAPETVIVTGADSPGSGDGADAT